MKINSVIMERGEYALIEIGEKVHQFAVVCNLNEDRSGWGYSCGYYLYGSVDSDLKEIAFCKALDRFCGKAYGDSYASRHDILNRAEQEGILEKLLDYDKI